MAPRIDRFRDELLVALAETATSGHIGYMNPLNVARGNELDFPSGWVTEAVMDLARQDLVITKYSPAEEPDHGIRLTVTGKGMDRALRLMAMRKIVVPQTSSAPPHEAAQRQGIPAADRMVTINHNEPAYQQVETGLVETIQAIERNNEYAHDDPEDQQQRIAELDAGRRLLKAARVRVEALMAVIKPALEYLAKKFVDNAISTLAKALLVALATWLGLSL